jgi:hypothetical protein
MGGAEYTGLGIPIFQIELLPAGHGDSVLLEYGSPASPARILVDAGPVTAYPAVRARLEEIPPERRRLDLLVVTHVDADHVEGVVKLLNDAELAVEVGELWFNGYRHLPGELGPPQGEMAGALAEHRSIAWNTAFGFNAVKRDPGRPPPRVDLPGGLSITVLAPTDRELERLRVEWDRACERAGLTPGSVEDALRLLGQTRRLQPLDTYLDDGSDLERLAATTSDLDRSAPNASSIVLLVEYAGRRVLLAGDSTPGALVPPWSASWWNGESRGCGWTRSSCRTTPAATTSPASCCGWSTPTGTWSPPTAGISAIRTTRPSPG